MKLIQHTYGLFPYHDFSFPEGEYDVIVENEAYHTYCKEVFRLGIEEFTALTELKVFYEKIDKESKINFKDVPYREELGILICSDFFCRQIDDIYSEEDKIRKVIYGLAKKFYCIGVTKNHEFDETKMSHIEYINLVMDKDGVKKAKDTFFRVSRELHDYLLILRTPYINNLDINYINMGGMYDYFCNDRGKLCTNIKGLKFNYYFPNTEKNKSQLQALFNKNMIIPLEELFLAKAKVYLRHENYSIAIIHAAIALEIVVPKYINGYLKINGINRHVIEDFNNKFGLSVRVKALLKLMIPGEYHHLITNVGTLINYRNRVMHEGKTNTFFKTINNINELINDCETLINCLKTVGKEKKIFQEIFSSLNADNSPEVTIEKENIDDKKLDNID